MAYLKKLEQLLKEKKHMELKKFCKEKLQFNPEDTDLLFYYAVSLEMLGEYDAAKNTFEKLFRITNDKIFRICEAVPEFMKGNKEQAVSILKYATRKDSDPAHLFFAFRVAIEGGEREIASEALKKAFASGPKKTVSLLQKYFAGLHEKRPERLLLFVALLELLKEAEHA